MKKNRKRKSNLTGPKLIGHLIILFFILVYIAIFLTHQTEKSEGEPLIRTPVNPLLERLFTATPFAGGVLNEGTIGTPTLVNPVLATSQADKDLVALVYSGLIGINKDGIAVPSIAERVKIEQREITFAIKKDAVFHDGEPLTAEDVAFTIESIQNLEINSPLFENWIDIGVEILDTHTIKLTAPRQYNGFIYNAEVGILPKHIWGDVPAEEFAQHEANIRPIGSGPYLVKDISFDQNGRPTQYILSAFSKYTRGSAFIKEISFSFFREYEKLRNAIKRGEITSSSSIDTDEVKDIMRESRALLKEHTAIAPSVFGIFFNSGGEGILNSIRIRRALSLAINKEQIINNLLRKYAIRINSPTPEEDTEERYNTELAIQLIENDGYELNDSGFFEDDNSIALSITLTVTDSPILSRVALEIERQWESIGIETNINIVPEDVFLRTYLRPREFQAILTGYTLSDAYDLFPFWHSSQINDPGVNIASYVNLEIDELLEEAQRVDIEERKMIYNTTKEGIVKDVPAVFIYSPLFSYLSPNGLKGVSFGYINEPADRFDSVHRWHFREKLVWNYFQRLGK